MKIRGPQTARGINPLARECTFPFFSLFPVSPARPLPASRDLWSYARLVGNTRARPSPLPPRTIDEGAI